MSDISSHFQIEVVTPEVISQNFGDEEMQIMIGGKQAREILILPGELKHCYGCCRTYSLVEQQQRPYCSLAVRRYSLAAFAAFDTVSADSALLIMTPRLRSSGLSSQKKVWLLFRGWPSNMQG